MRLIIFDVDGTLVDSQHHIVEAQGVAFAAHGLPAPTSARALSVVGLSLDEAFRELAGASGPVASLSEAYRAAWTDIRQKPDYAEVLYPGVHEMLAGLASHRETCLGIATGKSRRGVERLIASQGWAPWFVTIQTADGHPSKPHPSMILTALVETGVAPERACMVGDTSYDMAMAVAAGVMPVGVAWGYHEAAMLRAAGASVVARDVDELRAILGDVASEAA